MSEPRDNSITVGWQHWLERSPWLVLWVGVGGIGVRTYSVLSQAISTRIPADLKVRMVLDTLGLLAINLATVLFLFFALRLLVAGIPLLMLRDSLAGKEADEGTEEPDQE